MIDPVFEFGAGRIVVMPGKCNGKPAVFISRAKYPGEIGASAARENNPQNAMAGGEIALLFPTEEQALCVENALVGLFVKGEG